MSTAFSTPTGDIGNARYWAELRSALYERYFMTYTTTMPPFTLLPPVVGVGSRLDSLPYCLRSQQSVVWLMPYFASDEESPTNFTTATFWAAMGQDNFRAVTTVDGSGAPVYQYRQAAAGDIVGPWLVEDMQKAVSLLRKRWFRFTKANAFFKQAFPPDLYPDKELALAAARALWPANPSWGSGGYVLYQDYSPWFGSYYLNTVARSAIYYWERDKLYTGTSGVAGYKVIGKGADPLGAAGIVAGAWSPVSFTAEPDGSVRTQMFGDPLLRNIPADVLPAEKYNDFGYGDAGWNFWLLINFDPVYSN